MKERIKTIRKQSNMKQAEFGETIGVKRSAVTAYETGTRVPSNAVINAICDKYSINRAWLETGEGEMYIESNTAIIDKIVARYNGSGVFRAILETYITMPEDKQQAVEDFVARLIEYKNKGVTMDTLGVDQLPLPAEQAHPDVAQAE